ncbi:MAG: bifunctional riboflavin kinase/FAD synthetase [Bacteroidales bacterium]|nr:bifunctional riboflavin kinase/FAD synthetase [Bacteroidales bacterium]MCF8343523.1 bifunctional riboflavin kinase/FAD synthetase [Bacteroidales bacterium]MCF8349814.1 bifunctional riboflavin kinase/FAD synthetase [Bacteroidales bacterium]MCF8375934.1 bifunctional riboflavin kinase/FAD synthetase [Bacteroidales bacterium]
MKIYLGIEAFEGVDNPVVTVGTFDGVHRGHQKIIERMKTIARKTNGQTVLVTFYPHPRLVIHPDSSSLKFINTQKKKLALLEKTGVEHLIIIPFTREFSKTTSTGFIRQYVVDKIHAKYLIIGYDHHFGRNRLGDFSILYDLGKELGFEVERVPAQNVNNINVSSTKIRKALEEGKVAKANQLLGYEYSITGTVVKGERIGRKIGFPTSNIELEDKYKLITARGVYACRVEYNGNIYKGMGNIGVRPTIDHGEQAIEVHIFGFNQEIYGEEITIYFVERIRDEIKFGNLELLRQQLLKDREKVNEILED